MKENEISSEVYTTEGLESARQAAADLGRSDPDSKEAERAIAANTKGLVPFLDSDGRQCFRCGRQIVEGILVHAGIVQYRVCQSCQRKGKV